jgi:hypothetical protein
MALPPGTKKAKNGKKVYSQSARAVRWREENKVGEFAEDAAAADAFQPPLVETPPGPVSSPGEFSTESIGVVTTVAIPEEVPLAPHIETDQPNYFCENCKGTISIGDPECPVCEERLDWSGLR